MASANGEPLLAPAVTPRHDSQYLCLMRVPFLVGGFALDGAAQTGSIFFLARGLDVQEIDANSSPH